MRQSLANRFSGPIITTIFFLAALAAIWQSLSKETIPDALRKRSVGIAVPSGDSWFLLIVGMSIIILQIVLILSARRKTQTSVPSAPIQPINIPPSPPVIIPDRPTIEFYDSREMLIQLRGGIHQEARNISHGWVAWWVGSTVPGLEVYMERLDRLLIYHPEGEILRRFSEMTGERLEDYQASITRATTIARRRGVKVKWSQEPITNITMDDQKKDKAFARVEVLIQCRMKVPPHAILSSYIVKRNERDDLFQDLVRAYQEMWDKPNNIVPPR